MIKAISNNQKNNKTSSITPADSAQSGSGLIPGDYPLGRLGPVVLLLLDGWGVAPVSEANAISAAKLPYFLSLIKEYPVAILTTAEKILNTRYLIIGTGRESVETDCPPSTLSQVLASASLKQLKITEAERLVALTSFFNGGAEQPAVGEEWQIISETGNSEAPGMSSLALFSKALIKSIKKGHHYFIVAAIPALDLAASSGEALAAQEMAAALDKFLKKIIKVILEKQGVALVSSAHGNAERIRDLRTDLPDKEMTDNPVPLVIVGEKFKGKTIGGSDPVNNDLSLLPPAGTLANLAPTILQIMGLDKPAEMSGNSLVN